MERRIVATPDRAPATLWWRKLRAVLAGALVLGTGATLTIAQWSDQEYASSEVTAGTFTLVSRTNTQHSFASHDEHNRAELAFDATNLFPGAQRAAFVQLKNTGSVPGEVRISDVLVDMPAAEEPHTAFAQALDVTVVRTVDASANADHNVPDCTVDTPGGVDVGTLDTLPQFTPETVVVEPHGANIVNLCFILTLRDDAPNSAQGGSVTPTWVFTGTTPE